MWRSLVLLGVFGVVLVNCASPTRKLDVETQNRLAAIGKTPLADPVYRLSKYVVPNSYNLQLSLAENWETENKFSGVVTIDLKVVNKTNTIDLHTRYINISNVQVSKGKTEYNVTSQLPNEDTDIFVITLDPSLEVSDDEADSDKLELKIEYEGILSPTSMSGFYLSSYKNQDGETEYLATTQFESTSAREAFPCFDEPELKADFTVSIKYSGNYGTILSNTEVVSTTPDSTDNTTTVTFAKTPKMSTYLLAFIVSNFECTNNAKADPLPTNVCSRVGTKNNIQVALDAGAKILKVMENYTGYAFKSTEGITKLTQVAIPDFAAGAMENWGLVTYREADLLWEEGVSSEAYKQNVITTVAHELAHQWFGDLVTLEWWEWVFLNEGFATYFQYHAADKIDVSDKYELTKQFVVDQLQTALLADSVSAALPLDKDVSSPEDISNRFDSISYNKGGSILRMLHHILTEEKFKEGLATYISNNTEKNSNAENLWKSFDASVSDDFAYKIEDVMKSWTVKNGYPVVSVTANDTHLQLTQKKFSFDNTTSNTTWYVPITFTTNKTANTEPLGWLTPDDDEGLVLELPEKFDWVVVNNQQTGYYRVQYDDNLWEKIFKALDDSVDNINDLNRAQIVDDLLNFARGGTKTYSDVLTYLAYLKKETSYYAWYPALNGFSYLLNRIATDKVRTALMAYFADLITPFYEDVTFTPNATKDSHVDNLRRTLALTWACTLGNEDCIKNSKAQLAAYKKKDSDIPDPNLRTVVYCNALRNSDNASGDFEFLWAKMKAATLSTEIVTIQKSLGCAQDAEVLQKYMTEIVSGNDIRVQDVNYAFTSVYSSSTVGLDTAFDFLTTNYSVIVTKFGSKQANNWLFAIANRLTTQTQVDKLASFIGDKTDDSFTTSLNTAKANLKVTSSLETDLKKKFDISDNDDDNNSGTIFHINGILVIALYIFANFY